MTITRKGKIADIGFGLDNTRKTVGYFVKIEGDGWGCDIGKSGFIKYHASGVECSKGYKIKIFSDICLEIAGLLQQTGMYQLHELIGYKVLCMFDGKRLRDWKLSEEDI